MSKKEESPEEKAQGMMIAAGSLLGVGIGAAVGYGMGDLGNGIWIGAIIGVGAAFLYNAIKAG